MRSPDPVRLSLLSDRQKYAAQGLAGGLPGARVEIETTSGERPHQKSRSMLRPGDRLILRFAGGGGFGDPRRRDPALVRADVENGIVSPDAARRDYGRPS